jgi:hypothetical protein
MLGRTVRAGVLAGVATLALSVPSSALAVVTIGSNLLATPDNSHQCDPGPCTDAHRTLPATSQAPGGVLAKSDGVVVRWRIKVGTQTTPVALRVTRPGDSDTRTGAGTGPTVTPAVNQISTFGVQLPIQAGDTVGIDCCQQATLRAHATMPEASYEFWLPRLEDSPTVPFFSSPSADTELLVNADIEPDADADGFGDETQDQCPTDAGKRTECDPPETTITGGAPNKTDKTKVKFKFTSDEPDATFECKFDKKPYKACTSPRKVKRLKDGKHKFKVRAIDGAGNVDPSAAKDKFKVVD